MDPDGRVSGDTSISNEQKTEEPSTDTGYDDAQNNNGDNGAAESAVAPAASEQAGAQDTSEMSAGGNGETVQQVINNSDHGQAGDVNRTESDVAAKQEAAAAEQVQDTANVKADAAESKAEAKSSLSSTDAVNALAAEQAEAGN